MTLFKMATRSRNPWRSEDNCIALLTVIHCISPNLPSDYIATNIRDIHLVIKCNIYIYIYVCVCACTYPYQISYSAWNRCQYLQWANCDCRWLNVDTQPSSWAGMFYMTWDTHGKIHDCVYEKHEVVGINENNKCINACMIIKDMLALTDEEENKSTWIGLLQAFILFPPPHTHKHSGPVSFCCRQPKWMNTY